MIYINPYRKDNESSSSSNYWVQLFGLVCDIMWRSLKGTERIKGNVKAWKLLTNYAAYRESLQFWGHMRHFGFFLKKNN